MDEPIRMDQTFIDSLTKNLFQVREGAKKKLGKVAFNKLIGPHGKLRYVIREYPLDPDELNLNVQLNLTDDFERDIKIILEMMKTEYSKLFKILDMTTGKPDRQFVTVTVMMNNDNGIQSQVSTRYLV